MGFISRLLGLDKGNDNNSNIAPESLYDAYRRGVDTQLNTEDSERLLDAFGKGGIDAVDVFLILIGLRDSDK